MDTSRASPAAEEHVNVDILINLLRDMRAETKAFHKRLDDVLMVVENLATNSCDVKAAINTTPDNCAAIPSAIECDLVQPAPVVCSLIDFNQSIKPTAATSTTKNLMNLEVPEGASSFNTNCGLNHPQSSRVSNDQLSFIKGIDLQAALLLAELGVKSFADIAAFTKEDVTKINGLLGNPGRVSRECWIEQAAILATGNLTKFACRVVRGELSALARMPQSILEDKVASMSHTICEKELAEHQILSDKVRIVSPAALTEHPHCLADELMTESKIEATPCIDNDDHKPTGDNILPLPVKRRRILGPIAGSIAAAMVLVTTVSVSTQGIPLPKFLMPAHSIILLGSWIQQDGPYEVPIGQKSERAERYEAITSDLMGSTQPYVASEDGLSIALSK